jgi:hypothetical protein
MFHIEGKSGHHGERDRRERGDQPVAGRGRGTSIGTTRR